MKVRRVGRRILFATDLSESSAQAASWLRWLSGHFGWEAYIIYVLNYIPFGISAEEIAKERSKATERLDKFIRKHRLNQKAFSPVLLIGDTSVALNKFIDKHDISLIVLGSQAAGIKRLLAGSMSEELLRSANCPVLTVGPCVKRLRGSASIKRVLFPTNLARRSGSVLKKLRFLFKGIPGCKLTLAHFLRTENSAVVERAKNRKQVETKLRYLVPHELKDRISDIVVETFPPTEGILELSRELRADLVILAVRDAGPLTRAATHNPKSITPLIIQSSTCPVLTIRV
jgi:nucleotide-binding universal stress UspA family protein